MTQSGLFLSFEGIDGAGKSTHIDALARAFEMQGRVVTLTREPGGTPLAEKLRAIILNDAMDALTEALLVFAARRDHLQQLIEPALARGEVVISDRFTDATFAYQGGGRGYDWTTLLGLEQLVQTRPSPQGDFVRQPDLTLWFELDPEVAAQRLAGARVPDKFESQSAAFFSRVSDGYAQRLQADPGRFARIAADNPREAVWQDVLQSVRQKGWLA
ncbi:dTMP kinase [Rhodoferax sp. U2-2l]|uniref:dTMP kinase n=1 Tax=Rhodoferax sp. U2-2l TaxID=2884000 RepID=UPI001D0A2A2E|nr:dTMP kinase [Rhodoferax sp. U2-2l]MCB8747911.1 dTMP kinase [Rhodoferax sp. U2-2l]